MDRQIFVSENATMSETWTIPITVAAIVERDARFLLVEEMTSDGLRLTQPSGHLERGESLIEAVVREMLEETAHEFEPTHMVGAYMAKYFSMRRGEYVTYLRLAFAGTLGPKHDRSLDRGILRSLWMSRDELAGSRDRHRGPLVLRCVDDYLMGQRMGLDFIYTHPAAIETASPGC